MIAVFGTGQTCFKSEAKDGNITYVEDCELGFAGIWSKQDCLAKKYYWKKPYDHFSGGQLINLVRCSVFIARDRCLSFLARVQLFAHTTAPSPDSSI